MSGADVVRALPEPQLLTLARLAAIHSTYTWHMADCGCCVCFHPDADTSRGYLIGADGEADYKEENHA